MRPRKNDSPDAAGRRRFLKALPAAVAEVPAGVVGARHPAADHRPDVVVDVGDRGAQHGGALVQRQAAVCPAALRDLSRARALRPRCVEDGPNVRNKVWLAIVTGDRVEPLARFRDVVDHPISDPVGDIGG